MKNLNFTLLSLHNLRKLITCLIIAFAGLSTTLAQCEDPGLQISSITNIKQANCNDGEVKITTSDLSGATSVKAEYSITKGEYSRTEIVILDKNQTEFTFTQLPTGTFNVEIQYFCGANTLEPSYVSEQSTVEIGGSYLAMNIRVGVRNTLPGINSGYADIIISDGSGYYPNVYLEKSAGGNVWNSVQSWSNVNLNQKVSSYNLSDGQYRVRVTDGCAIRVESFEIQSIVLDKFIGSSLLNKFAYKISDGVYGNLDCGVLKFDLDGNIFSGMLAPYNFAVKDSLIKYFEIKWYYDGEDNRKDTVYITGSRDASPETRFVNWGEIHLQDNSDKNYYQDYSIFKDKKIIIDFTLRGSSTVVPHTFLCSGDQKNLFGIITSTGTEPEDCPVFGVKIPKYDIEESYRTARFCFPLSYTLKYFEDALNPVIGNELNNPDVQEQEYNLNVDDFFNGGKKYHLGPGYYRFEFADVYGNSWVDSIVVEGMLSSIKTNPIQSTSGVISRFFGSSAPLPYLSCISDNFKSDTCFALSRRFISGVDIPANTKITYTKVPDGFYFEEGFYYNLKKAITSFEPNRDYRIDSSTSTDCFAVFPAGDYEINLTTCDGDSRKMEFTITYGGLEGIDEDPLRPRCNGADYIITQGVLKRYGSSDVTNFFYRILSYNGIYNLTEMHSEGINTAGAWYEKGNPLPLPKKGIYEIVFANSAGTAFQYLRTVEVGDSPIPELTNSSKAFVCPGNNTTATVFAIPEKKGALPFTYKLYEEDGETLIDSKVDIDNYDPVVFTGVNLGQGQKCVLQIEHCNGNSSQQMSVLISSLKDFIKFNETGAICGDESLNLKVDTLPAAGFTYEWYFYDNITEYKLSDSNIYNSSGTYNQLLDSIYGAGNPKPSQTNSNVRLKINGPICDNDVELTQQLQVSMPKLLWNPDGTLSIEERREWNNPNNWLPKGFYPSACTDVYIPGNLGHYPQLIAGVDESGNQLVYVCKNIYFMQGGEITRPDLLSYEKAHVQLNFGLEDPLHPQDVSTFGLNPNNIGITDNALQHLVYSASHTGTNSTLSRNHWHMLSAPLKQMTSGGFAFGGYPLTYMRKWDMLRPTAGSVMEGRWTGTYKSMIEDLKHGEGYILWVNKHQQGVKMYEESAERPDGYINDQARKVGLKEVNGIVQFPYHQDEDMIRAHRTHKKTGNDMTYYYIWEDKKSEMYMQVFEKNDVYTFDESAYRFITEDENNQFQQITTISYNNMGEDKTLLVGNPYMSTIDFHEFYELNKDMISPNYSLWRGTGVNTGVYEQYSYDPQSQTGTGIQGGVRYIAPMQSFIVTTLAAQGEQKLIFDVEKLSVVSPLSSNPLRVKGQNTVEKNQIRMQASTTAGQCDEFVIMHGEAYSNHFVMQEDAYKMFGQISSMPYIFTMANDWYLSVNRLNNTDMIVPVGLKTKVIGEITLSLSGMVNYEKAGKIIFIDAEKQKETDITSESEFHYSFTNTKEGIQEGRFFICFEPKFQTGLNKNSEQNIKAYKLDDGICISSLSSDIIQSVTIYDVNGRLLYENPRVNNFILNINQEPINQVNVILIKAITDRGISNIKLLK